MKDVRKPLLSLLIIAGLLLSACAAAVPAPAAPAPAEGGESAGDAELPTIHIYQNSGFMQNHPEGSDPERLEQVRQYIREQVGVNPVTVVAPSGDAGIEKLNLLLGSSDPIDVFQENWGQYKEAIIPLTDLLEEHGQDILAAFPEEAWVTMKDSEGTIWGVPRLGLLNVTPTWIRADLLDEAGLEMPTTVEELEAAMEVFEANNSDFVLMTDYNNLRRATIGGWTEYGESNWLDPSDNTIKPAELQPGFADWVAKMAEWYEKGWIFADSFAEYDHLELQRTGNVGVHAGWYSRITIGAPLVDEVVPAENWVIVDGLTGPAGFLKTIFVSDGDAYLITKKAEHPEDIIRFMNWQFGDIANFLTVSYGLEGEGWEWTDEENSVVKTDPEWGYYGETVISMGPGTEFRFRVDDPLRAKHSDYLLTQTLNFEGGKIPFDFDVVYNSQIVNEEVPTLGDIERLTEEEIIKFITGVRPLDEWDAFIDELYQAGMDDWIAVHTRLYNEAKGQ